MEAVEVVEELHQVLMHHKPMVETEGLEVDQVLHLVVLVVGQKVVLVLESLDKVMMVVLTIIMELAVVVELDQ